MRGFVPFRDLKTIRASYDPSQKITIFVIGPERVRGYVRLERFDLYFLINHTSDTWQPRPLPPRFGSAVQVSVSVPSRVASAGRSNSSGFMSLGLSKGGCTSIESLAFRPIFTWNMSPV